MFILGQKFELKNAPTFCRLTTTSPMDSDHLYWLIFSHSRGVQAYSILVSTNSFIDYNFQPQSKSVEPVVSIGDIFPVLEIGDLPGSAIRSHCWITQGYRFSVVGFDTGYIAAAVCTMHSGTIIDRYEQHFRISKMSLLKLESFFFNLNLERQ